MNVLISLGFMLGISLLPIYLWESGGIQISHIVLALSCLIYFLWKGFKADLPEFFLLLLALYIFVRESVVLLGGDTDMRSFFPAIYMFFNLIIFTTIRRLASNYCGKKWLSYGIFAAAGIATIGVLALGYKITADQEGGRAVGTFNNPNQLGYFSVCLYSMAVILYRESNISKSWLLVLVCTALFLAVASLSKAAMVSMALSVFFIIFVLSKSKRLLPISLISFFLILATVYYLTITGYLDQFAFFRRLMDIGSQSDDSLEGRGYTILIQAGALEFIFGFGTTQVKNIIGFEVHSTIGGVFINYGIIGCSLFLTFLIVWMKQILKNFGWLSFFIIAFPPMLYGLTHNGIRFTMFWILLGLSFSASQLKDASTATFALSAAFKKSQQDKS